ncbi:N-methyl-L-tryptophan oxidase [Nocardioides islandensis]|uniref:N-methyl-L-tryptophan oxidase n=1 Tax=Nocardioides islandensis TaxID=433663 RepID=A0A930YGG4_9ACTN|nr:N-methyl-L-tryptophan oxidase [Nocardioides islandensis]MBF4765898.1 N-methyl-L-tryptophan oxidase [Nocardioides islandensis]
MESYDVVVVGLGALGSSAAMHLARRGKRVLGLERFELGHRRGASHDSSRILRHSYHTPAYVRLTQEAYADWAALERWSGEQLVTVTGGLDLFPPDPAIAMVDYTLSLTDVGIPFELLDVAEIGRRWPQFSLPSGTVGLYQERGAIVPAARTTALMQKLAVAAGAELRGSTQVLALSDSGGRVEVELEGARLTADRVVVCADAWTNEVLAGIDVRLPLETTLEQATYFAPSRPGSFAPHHLPLWIWMDDPSFYGFPCYGEPTVKAAQDCGGPVIDTSDPLSRTTDPDPEMLERMASFMRRLLPESGDPVRSIRCQYTLTPDRDLVLASVPGHEAVSVGLGAAHAFKFAPTFGRILADLATSGTSISDISAFRLDRAALTDPAYQTHWLV